MTTFTLFYHSPAGVKDWARFTPLPGSQTVHVEVDHGIPNGRVWHCEFPVEKARLLYAEYLKNGHVRMA